MRQRTLTVVSFVGSVAAALFILSGPSRGDEPRMRAHFVDVGQGAATLLEFPCGAVLIDTGAQDPEHVARLISYLDRFFGGRPDLNATLAEVIITHPHIDHSMGLRPIAGKFKILNYVDDGQMRGSGKANVIWIRKQIKEGKLPTRLREVWDDEIQNLPERRGLTDNAIDPIKCDNCDPKIVILSGGMEENPGWSQKDFNNLNNHSLVTRVDFGESSFLFTGDMEAPALSTLVEYYSGTDMLRADVYQVGHHGSYNATTDGFLEKATPQLAVISCGEWDFGKDTPKNPFTTFAYGHPRYDAIDLLNHAISTPRRPAIQGGVFLSPRKPGRLQIDKAIYCTGWDGTITIDADLHGKFRADVETHKSPPSNKLEPPEPEPVDHEDGQPAPMRGARLVAREKERPRSARSLIAAKSGWRPAAGATSLAVPPTVDDVVAHSLEGSDMEAADLATARRSPSSQRAYAGAWVTDVTSESGGQQLSLNRPISINIHNFKQWLISSQLRSDQLILYLDGMPLKGLHPDSVFDDIGVVTFVPRRTPESKEAWNRLLTRRDSLGSVAVSLGSEEGPPLKTKATDVKLRAINRDWVFWTTLFAFLGISGLFLWLSISSNILRDPLISQTEDPNPYSDSRTEEAGSDVHGSKVDRPPYSLGLTQMAFWFILVLGVALYLWVMTEDFVVFSPTILALMGVSATTALGAVFVDSTKRQSLLARRRDLIATSASVQAKIDALKVQVDDKKLARVDRAAAEQQLDMSHRQLLENAAQLDSVKRQLQPRMSTHFIFDILSDDTGISLHRFQIAVWTVVLGFIFIVSAYRTLAVPDFDATLLALMGISSGTYIGFKFSETRT